MNDEHTGSAAICALGVGRAHLSAWRDRALSKAETQRLDAHMGQCDVCRRRLAEYEVLALALRSERLPLPDERLWSGIRAALAQGDGARSAQRRHDAQRHDAQRRRRHALEWLGAVAAVVLITIGFVQLFAQLRSHPTVRVTATATPFVSATPTLSPARPLVWQSQTLPISFAAGGRNRFSVSGGDGNTAYICEMPTTVSTTTIHVWATHDRGMHWRRMTDVRLDEPRDTCRLIIDETNPQIVAMWMVSQPIDSQPSAVMRITFDGGASWQALAWRYDQPIQLISWRNLTFGSFAEKYVTDTWGGIYPANLHMMVSADGMHTWKSIDEGFTSIDGMAQQINRFWLNPISGELLAETSTPYYGGLILPNDRRLTLHLWRSTDAGQHWMRLNDAPQYTDPSGYLVQQPIGTLPWQICTYSFPLICSSDGGETWSQHIQHDTRTLAIIGIAPDGSVLGVVAVGAVDTGTGSQTTPQADSARKEVLRLPPNADVWQSLGELPVPYSGVPDYIAGVQRSNGVLWVWGIGASGANAYTATYP